MGISEYFIRFLERRDSLSAEERQQLASLSTEQLSFAPGEVIVPCGRAHERSCLLLSGMAARVHDLPGRSHERVITALHVPGDFVDLHLLVLSRLEHQIVAVGPAVIEHVSHEQLRELTRFHPHLARLLWMSTAIDAAIHRQWLVAAASLRSSAHLAHLICEIYTRLAAVGAASDYRFELPLLQRELAEILGYSAIHVNRSVRDLRERGLIRWSGSQVEILEWGALATLARFNPDYLDLTRTPR